MCGILAGVRVRLAAIRSTGKINRIQRRLVINRATFPLTTRVTCLSQTHRRYLMEQERIPDAKLEIITNGVDLARFVNGRPSETVREALGGGASAPLVGIVAMLRPEKAHDVFLRAAARAAARVPEARFLIIGDGPKRPELEALKSLSIRRPRFEVVHAHMDVGPVLGQGVGVGDLFEVPDVDRFVG